jgi:hypothetical protein
MVGDLRPRGLQYCLIYLQCSLIRCAYVRLLRCAYVRLRPGAGTTRQRNLYPVLARCWPELENGFVAEFENSKLSCDFNGAQGRNETVAPYQLLMLSHFGAMFHCIPRRIFNIVPPILSSSQCDVHVREAARCRRGCNICARGGRQRLARVPALGDLDPWRSMSKARLQEPC